MSKRPRSLNFRFDSESDIIHPYTGTQLRTATGNTMLRNLIELMIIICLRDLTSNSPLLLRHIFTAQVDEVLLFLKKNFRAPLSSIV